MKMEVETNMVTTDPRKFAAVAKDGRFQSRYIGDEGETRAQVKRKAIQQLEALIAKANATRNGN
jgi:hypothetical protein